MPRLSFFLRWLALAALADWLVTRTLARLAIFMPKSPPVLTAYQVVVSAGQVASVLAALLALGGMLWLGWMFRGQYKGLVSLTIAALIGISLTVQVIVPGASLQLVYHALVLGAVLWTLVDVVRWEAPRLRKVAGILAGGALLLGGFFQVIQTLAQVLGWSKPPEFILVLFNLGEALAVLCPLVVWWAWRSLGISVNGHYVGQVSIPAPNAGPWKAALQTLTEASKAGHYRSAYVWAAIPALGFSLLELLNPAMAGILAIWSTGLTLFLPWPFYALSLWLWGVVVIASWQRRDPTGPALLLLAAGGYAPQLSSQVFFGLTGLFLLCRSIPQATHIDAADYLPPLTSPVIESN